MARKNPLGRIKDAAIGTLKNPLGAAGKAVEQAKGTAAIGKMVAGQVTRTAASKAAEGVGAVTTRATRGRGETPAPESAPSTGSAAHLRPVPSVNEAGHPPAEKAAPARKAAPAAKKTPASKAATAKKAPAKKAAATATKAKPAKKAAPAAKKVAPEVTPADIAKNVAKKSPAQSTATKAPAKKTSTKPAPVKKAPAQQAAPAKKTPAKPAPAQQATPAKKTPAKKAPARKTAAAGSPGDRLPVRGRTQKPPVDPATTKAVASESETLRKGAEVDKG